MFMFMFPVHETIHSTLYSVILLEKGWRNGTEKEAMDSGNGQN